ncbi:DUF3232 domain-containing protein [Geoalkalibacter subterraneus]|uniref:Uncharacterized protein n=1 Tax=Geoalkalibacter subterraneus TaxID=483547 RepID=A0A0B5FL82_9BACT|nr:DUF3232 domain-containing protein [Geoalkalibacter subterraneus]AJF08153.1 hypothetical protein GSUB_16760 [Geoalkalibacter subterraneus]
MDRKSYILGHFRGKEECALERFNKVVEVVAGDDVAVSLLEKLLDSAERYFGTVCKMEARLKMARFRLEGEELRDLTETLDRNRRMAHEALISNLHIFNRYALKEFGEDMPIGGVFSKNPEAIRDRIAVGDWAGELLCALYVRRKR